MKVLLIGSGGRESAFAWKIAQSPLLTELFIAPGNGGTSNHGNNESIHETNLQGLADFALEYNIELIIVGPEAPLVEGIYDFFQNDATLKHIPIIGPSQEGAMLEGSKAFAKSFMQRHQIPTAAYMEVTMDTLPEGLEFLESLPSPYVLKADGLAAGKGVLILQDLNEARTELLAMLDGKFGNASTKVVIEEFMKGIEFSVFVLSDGVNYKILPTAKDYKRIGEGDTGLNTGGMGAVSPPPFVTEAIMQQVEKEVIKPTIEGLLKDNIVYKGFIYIGLMLTPEGKAKVVEYNCRMGDPETEVVLPRIQTDILSLFISLQDGKLNEHKLDIIEDTAVTVIMASGGYPEDYEKGKVITGIDKVTESIVFHCGTKKDSNGNILSNGGRVLAVTSLGDTWEAAVEKCYKSIQYIHFDQQYYRRDIGTDLR
ncbi:MAG: phosphoribosylamine--glycine ligase [Chitinophagales bacterium]|nr:phosphoribosylamine--glycine ligase [Chitinophagales bacterium]